MPFRMIMLLFMLIMVNCYGTDSNHISVKFSAFDQGYHLINFEIQNELSIKDYREILATLEKYELHDLREPIVFYGFSVSQKTQSPLDDFIFKTRLLLTDYRIFDDDSLIKKTYTDLLMQFNQLTMPSDSAAIAMLIVLWIADDYDAARVILSERNITAYDQSDWNIIFAEWLEKNKFQAAKEWMGLAPQMSLWQYGCYSLGIEWLSGLNCIIPAQLVKLSPVWLIVFLKFVSIPWGIILFCFCLFHKHPNIVKQCFLLLILPILLFVILYGFMIDNGHFTIILLIGCVVAVCYAFWFLILIARLFLKKTIAISPRKSKT